MTKPRLVIRRRSHPFDRAFVRFGLHAGVVAMFAAGLFFSLEDGLLVPVSVATMFLLVVEGFWLYYNLRR